MKMQRHTATTAQMGALYPFIPYSGPQVDGPIVGRLLSGTPLTFDRFYAAQAGVIAGLAQIIMGKVGYWKSTYVKTNILRSLPWGRRISVFDYKAEYLALCHHLGFEPLNFGETVSVNPIDPARLNPRQQVAELARLVQMAQQVTGALPAELHGNLRAALQTATSRTAIPGLGAVVSALRDPDPQSADELRLTADEVFRENRPLAEALSRYLGNGDLGGVFDGQTSPQLQTLGQLTVFNFNALSKELRPIVIKVIADWLDAAWQKGDQSWLFDETIYDECWTYFQSLDFSLLVQKSVKLQRMHGVAQTFVIHRPSDLLAVGDASSQAVSLARGMVADTQIQTIFYQEADDIPLLREMCGLTPKEIQIVRTLEKGQALWRLVGQPPFVVEHFTSPAELPLTATNQNVDRKAAPERDPAHPGLVPGSAASFR